MLKAAVAAVRVVVITEAVVKVVAVRVIIEDRVAKAARAEVMVITEARAVVRHRVIMETKADNKVMAEVRKADKARVMVVARDADKGKGRVMGKTAARVTAREADMALREILISINISISTDMVRVADRGDRVVSNAACRWHLKRLPRQ